MTRGEGGIDWGAAASLLLILLIVIGVPAGLVLGALWWFL